MPLTFYRCVSFKHRQMYSFYRMMGRGEEKKDGKGKGRRKEAQKIDQEKRNKRR